MMNMRQVQRPAVALALGAAALLALGCGHSRATTTPLSSGSLTYDVDVSRDRRTLVSIELSETFDVVARRLEREQELWRTAVGPAEYDIGAVAVSNNTVWVASEAGVVRGIELRTGRLQTTWNTGYGATAIAAVGDWIAVGTAAGVLCIRRTKDGALLHCLAAFTAPITDIATNGVILAATSESGSITTWTLPNLEERNHYTLDGAANGIDIRGHRLAIAMSTRPLRRTPELHLREKRGEAPMDPGAAIYVIDTRSGNTTRLTGHTRAVTDVVFMDDDRIASSSWDRTVRITDLRSQSSYVVARFAHLVRKLRRIDRSRIAVAAWSLSPGHPTTAVIRLND